MDAINKLMYCLFELESTKMPREVGGGNGMGAGLGSRYPNAERILVQFLEEVGEFQKVESLRRSDNCLFEVMYFYLGRLRRKNGNRSKAI